LELFEAAKQQDAVRLCELSTSNPRHRFSESASNGIAVCAASMHFVEKRDDWREVDSVRVDGDVASARVSARGGGRLEVRFERGYDGEWRYSGAVVP
jgi:hypothetical protein